jgi:PAS domain S-box-containing protein
MDPILIKILLVENDALHTQIIRDMTRTGQDRYDLAQIETVGEALAFLERRGADVVLLSLPLSVQQSYDAIDAIHARDPRLPIIVLTSTPNDALASDLIQAGAQDFLIKWELNAHLLLRSIRFAYQRARGEAQRGRDQSQYQELIVNSGLFIGSHDEQGRILSANQRILDFLNLSSVNELAGFRVSDFLSSKAKPLFTEYLQTVLEKGHASGVVEFRSPAGEKMLIEYTNSLSPEPTGEIIVRCLGRDVTERYRAESELRESEERFRLALTAAQMGAWEWNLALDRMTGDEYMRALFDMHDWSLDAFLNKIHHDDRELVQEYYRLLVEGQEFHHLQFRIFDYEGQQRWVESSASLRQDQGGNPVRAYGVLQDVTLQKSSDESYRLLSLAVQNAEDAIMITTSHQPPREPQIVYANPAFLKMTGYSSEDLIGRTPRVLEGLNTNVDLLDQQHEALGRGESFSGETINYRKDGSEYTVAWHITPVRNQMGEITHFISVQRNISAHRRFEERLTQQAALLDSAQDAIIVRDLDDEVMYWNRGAQRLYGWSSEEVKGRRLTELLYKDPPPDAQKAKRALYTQGKWGGECRQFTQDGREVIVQSRWTLLSDTLGRPKSVLVINTDVTEKARLESLALRAQRLESIGALASGIAHDLNNVLAPILMALHTLQQRFTDEGSQRWLTLIHKSAERGRDLIDQVLSFAKGAEGERTPLQISHIIKDISKILQETLPKNIELQLVLPEGLWMVIGDTTQLHQLLMNLCINARDAMPDGGQLLIKVRNRFLVEEEERLVSNPHQKQYIRITVADTGVGISPEIIDRVFDPFFTTKEKGQGSGLGLSTVQGIVRGHGGYVNVISQLGKGTQFKIYLPAQDIAIADPIEEQPQILPTGNGELIMVIDDEADIREITTRTLESNGYRVIAAKDGREAVELYQNEADNIHLVLTDMVMPNLDGPGTIRALMEINPGVRIVATSGVKTTGKLAEATEVGAKTFLPKPYTADKLLTVIAETLG